MTTHYELLGVKSDATPEEIKHAWQRLAKGLHPDRVGGEGHERMAAVNAAYTILSDPEKRAHYDRTGSDGGQMKDIAYQAEQRIAVMFADFLDSDGEVYGDLIERMRAVTRKNTDNLKDGILKQRRKLLKLEKRAKRVKGPELFLAVVKDKVNNATQLVAAAEIEMEVLAKIMEMLNAYTDVEPQTPPSEPPMMTTIMIGGSTFKGME